MGVPSLFRWIKERFPNTIRGVDKSDVTDIFYIDFNAMIHRCCKPPLGPPPRSEGEVFDNIRRYLINVIEKVSPRYMVYISTDGVAPSAKMTQQRARRYADARGRSKANESTFVQDDSSVLTCDNPNVMDGKAYVFDSNSITPGTDFMRKLDTFMIEFLRYQVSTDWAHLVVIYSSSDVPGEGEHKIVEFIRAQIKYSASRNESEAQSGRHGSSMAKDFGHLRGRAQSCRELTDFLRLRHAIYSSDADFIFLGIALHCVDIKLMRNDQDFESKQRRVHCNKCGIVGHSEAYCGDFSTWHYVYFDVNTFKREMNITLSGLLKRSYDLERVLDDFTFLCFLCGNDFVPNMQCFDIRFGAMDNIIFLLTRSFNRKGTYIVENGTINHACFKSLLRDLCKFENSYYFKKLTRIREARKRFGISGEQEIWLNTDAGRDTYYAEKLNATCDDDIARICEDYISILSWTLSYYYTGVKTWSLIYPHRFAPLAVSVYKFYKKQRPLKRDRPLRQLEQLVAVMPPKDRELLPQKLRYVFEAFVDFYPDENNVKCDMFDRIIDWQAVMMLPFLDFDAVMPRVRAVIEDLELRDAVKNVRGVVLMFISDKNDCFEFLFSLYKNINQVSNFNNRMIVGRVAPYFGFVLPFKQRRFNGCIYNKQCLEVVFECA